MRRRERVYIVIGAPNRRENGDEPYIIHSVWTSYRKAEKKKDELNARGEVELLNDYGVPCFAVETKGIWK